MSITFDEEEITLSGGPRRLRQSDAPTPVITIVHHRQHGRIGDSVDLLSGAIVLGRYKKLFAGRAIDDPKVSRKHLQISLSGNKAVLVDLDSRNGTYIRGRAIDQATVEPGEMIRVGDTLLTLSTRTCKTPDDTEIIGFSPAICAVRQELAKSAPHENTVLLVGETGTGKDLAAKEIHRLSGREGEFVAINCGALPENLLESELFGYKKGAFSGATTSKEGLFQVAHGGTLFLDEISEMSPGMQAKLLRVLQNKEVRSLGATSTRMIDTRVVAASNRNLIEAVNDKTFRGDLYSRLSQVVITMPPLRDRREDIPALMASFLARKKVEGHFSRELVEAFLNHNWPFNVRELESLVSVCVMDAYEDGEMDLTSGVEKQLRDHTKIHIGDRPQAAATVKAIAPTPAKPRKQSRVRFSRDELEKLLKRFRGNVKSLANHLGKHRYQVYRWIKSHNLDPNHYR